jgi:hypothetical protein
LHMNLPKSDRPLADVCAISTRRELSVCGGRHDY